MGRKVLKKIQWGFASILWPRNFMSKLDIGFKSRNTLLKLIGSELIQTGTSKPRSDPQIKHLLNPSTIILCRVIGINFVRQPTMSTIVYWLPDVRSQTAFLLGRIFKNIRFIKKPRKTFCWNGLINGQEKIEVNSMSFW